MIAWNDIDTVLLDMDGTLLDLHFDNYFWLEYLPRKWGELHDLDPETARAALLPKYADLHGTLSWYCVDYWSEHLDIDVMALKEDLVDLIRYRPTALEFLERLRDSGKQRVLVTNAHQKLLRMKLQRTGLDRYFEHLVSAHDLGVPKEEPDFWHRLGLRVPFVPERSILIDDNLTVLRTAVGFGVAQVLTIARPDSRMDGRDTGEFTALTSFGDLLVS